MNKKIKTILIKYFTKSITYNELIELTKWVKESSEQSFFEEYIRVNYLVDTILMDFNTQQEREKLLLQINQIRKKIRRKKQLSFFKYAAILTVSVSLISLVYLKKDSFINTPLKVTQHPELPKSVAPKNGNITLTLDDGSELVLNNNKPITLKNGKVNSESIVYTPEEETKTTKTTYNYLTIPKGAKYMVQLSDCTKVWLNSNTKLKYPTSFAKQQPREVELVYGEAFFDVTKSKDNYNNSFKVTVENQTIEVLGTEFNIKAYNNDSKIITTLVEGKVTVKNQNNKVHLSPSEQSITNRTDNTISVQKITHVFDEIAWKEGYFVFKQQTIRDIMKSLARWYDIEYIFKNSEIEKKRFTGVIYREVNIEHILKQLQRTKEIKIEQQGNKITIQ